MTGNKIYRILAIHLILANLILLHPQSVLADCECVPPATPAAAFNQSDAVFVGTVTSIIAPSQTSQYLEMVQYYHKFVPPLPKLDRFQLQKRFITFQVADAWIGVTNTQTTLLTAGGAVGCGYHFQVGETYLVYSSRGEEGRLETSICSRTATTLMAQKAQDFDYLQSRPKLNLWPISFLHLALCLVLAIVVIIIPSAAIWGVRRQRKPSMNGQ